MNVFVETIQNILNISIDDEFGLKYSNLSHPLIFLTCLDIDSSLLASLTYLFTNVFQRVEMLVRSCYGSSLKFLLLSVSTGPRVQGLSKLDGVPDNGDLP